MITIKGIEQLILILKDADPELKSARPYGEFRANNHRADSYPVLFYEYSSGEMIQTQPGKFNREVTMALGVAIQLLEGRINEIDMKSRCESILTKTVIKLRESSVFADLGIRFVDKNFSFSNLDDTGDDLITGVFTRIRFTMPVIVCENDLPYLPLGDQPNTYAPANPSSILCSLISDCPIIEEIQDDINILFTLTGGTGSFSCSALTTCPEYVAVSGLTYQNAADIAAISGSTSGGVGTLEQVTASGNTADRSIILQGDGGSFDLVRQVIFKDTNPVLSGASDPSIGIDYNVGGPTNLLLRSPGQVLHLVGLPIVDSSVIPSVTDSLMISERTSAVSGIGFGFLSGGSSSFNYARLSARQNDGSSQGSVFIVASGMTGSTLVSFPNYSGMILLDADASFGGNGASDSGKIAKYGDEGQIRASSSSGGAYAFRADSTFGGAGLGIFAANGQGFEVVTNTGKGGSIITQGDQIGLQVENDSDTTQPALDVTNNGTADIAHFEGSGSLVILSSGALQWSVTSGATITKTNLGLDKVRVSPGANAYTGLTDNNTVVGVIGSPTFTSVTASDFISGGTNLNQIFAPIGSGGGTATRVQPGTNITTGGTASAPIVNVSLTPAFTSVSAITISATTFVSGGTNLANLIGQTTYVQEGSNIITGGTATRPSVRVSSTPAFSTVSATTMSATTFVEGNVSLASKYAPISVVATRVQPGTNISTGGTASAPVVNVSSTPVFTSVSATTISASTFVQNGTAIVPTYVQGGTNITTGGTASAPTVNLVASPSVTSIAASGAVSGGSIYNAGILQPNIQAIRLTGDVSTTSASFVDVSGMTFSIGANAVYNFEYTMVFQSSNTGTGTGWSVSGPASPTMVAGRVEFAQSAGNAVTFITAYDTGAAVSSVPAANTNYIAAIKGIIVNGANAGTLALRFVRSGAANTITAKAGSVGLLIRIA